MSLILQVGEIDQMVKPPKDFPKCSNYNVNKINGWISISFNALCYYFIFIMFKK